MSSNWVSELTSIGAACGGNAAWHLPHLPVSARWRTGTRLTALHSLHTRRMPRSEHSSGPPVARPWICYGRAVAKRQGEGEGRRRRRRRRSRPRRYRSRPRRSPRSQRSPRAPTRPSLPLPPPPPPPPATRDELAAHRDIGRLLRYGEQFGPHKIDIRMLPLQLPVASGSLAICDPAVAEELARPRSTGQAPAPFA